MKKFLSILLALAVGFTFTFGSAMSAFAASTNESEYDVLVEQAASQVSSMANAAYGEAVKALTDADVAGLGTADANLWKAAAPVYQAKIAKAIADKTKEIKDLYDTAANQNDLDAWELNDAVAAFNVVTGANYQKKGGGDLTTPATAVKAAIPTTVASMNTAITTDADVILAVAKAYAQGKADDAVIAIKGIDVTKYSKTINPATKMSSQDMATAIINEAVAEIGKLDFAGADTTSEVDTELKKLGDMRTATYNAVDGTIGVSASTTAGKILDKFVVAKDTTYNVTVYAIDAATKYNGQDLITVKAEEEANASLAVKKAEYLAKVESNYATYIRANNTAAGKEEADAYKAGMTEIINAATTDAELTAIAATANDLAAPTGNYASDKALIEKLEVVANKYIVEGYDAKGINDIVAAAKVAAYKDAAAWTGYNTAVDDIKAAVASQFDTAIIAAEVAAAEKALEALTDADTTNYYDAEITEIKALYDTIIAELKACISQKEVDAVKTKYAVTANYNNPTGLTKIANKTTVQNAIKKTATGDNGWNANVTAVQAYGVYLNAGLDATKDGYRDFVGAGYFTNTTTINQTALADLYAKAGARTTAEAYAKIADAKAALEAVKTVGQVAAAAKAIEDQIAALPAATAITESDLAAVEAAWKAYHEFVDETGSDISATSKINLTKAVTAAKNAEKLAINKAIAAYTGKTITSADEADILALLTRANDFNDNTATGKIFAGEATITVAALQGYLKTLRTEAKDAVVKAIAALPITVTEADLAKVDAAKALYDAYVAKYTDYKTDLNDLYNTGHGFNANAATDLSSVKADLDKAVKAADKIKAEIEEANKWTDDDAKAYVQDLSIAARTAKVGKKVKVTINADVQKLVDNGFTVEYKFYKSTKKSSGYKNTVNKTTNTYTNTNPVKGKNYYKVKLVVKNADGAVVATTPLTQCKYGVRTIK